MDDGETEQESEGTGADIREMLQLQMSELEMLQSMFPNQDELW